MAGEKNLADALVELNGVDGAKLDVPEIASRERRRVRRWAIATTALWVVAAAYFVVLLSLYLVFLHPVIHEFLTNPYARDGELSVHAYALIAGLKALMFWPVLLALAAICTVLFTLASRRATLRQIQSSLTEISEQLTRLASDQQA